MAATAYDLAPGEDGEPTPLDTWQLTGQQCPQYDCGLQDTSGTHQWRNCGPYQLLSRHTYHCPAGHSWTHETDGG